MNQPPEKPTRPAKAVQAISDKYLIVLLSPTRIQEGLSTLSQRAGVNVLNAAESHQAREKNAPLPAQCAIVFEAIGVAVVRCPAARLQRFVTGLVRPDGAILAIEPERAVHALPRTRAPHGATAKSGRLNEATATWGIQATKTNESAFSGQGIRIAILDTGLDLTHPDFAKRKPVSRSFIEGEDAQDGNGHGTHCAGIACGPREPSTPPRYGVAFEAEIYAGKVLGDAGNGSDSAVLDGINWAVENKCHIISLSLGSAVEPEQGYSKIFEEVAKRALAAGTVIIAAAGNDSRRPDFIAPVSHPANCPSILAVAAVDEQLDIAPFSSGGLVAQGGQVDVAAPGVDIYSSWPLPQKYNTISGTSMATPFVAGIAALHAQANDGGRGRELLNLIVQNTRRLELPSRDVGSGLIQAP